MTKPTDLGAALQEENLTLGNEAQAEEKDTELEDQVVEESQEAEEGHEPDEESEEADGEETQDEEQIEDGEAEDEQAEVLEEPVKPSIAEIENRLKERDEWLQDIRENINQEWETFKSEVRQVEKQLEKPITIGNQPAYAVSDEEFEAAQDDILAMDDGHPQKKDFLQSLSQARKERQMYKKLMARHQKIAGQREKQLQKDVDQIKSALKDISPDYEKHFVDIEQMIQKEFADKPDEAEKFVNSNISEKFKVVSRLLKDSGLEQRVQSKKPRPNLAAPVGAGKGKRSTPAGKSSKRIFSRAEIKAMSPQQYEKLEKEIDLAMKEGRVK